MLAEIAGTSLDEGTKLEALAQLGEDEQRKLAERAKAGEQVSDKHVKGAKFADLRPETIKQASAFHTELMDWAEEFCCRVEAWRTAHVPLGEEEKLCVMQAFEMIAIRLQRQAQALDGR